MYVCVEGRSIQERDCLPQRRVVCAGTQAHAHTRTVTQDTWHMDSSCQCTHIGVHACISTHRCTIHPNSYVYMHMYTGTYNTHTDTSHIDAHTCMMHTQVQIYIHSTQLRIGTSTQTTLTCIHTYMCLPTHVCTPAHQAPRCAHIISNLSYHWSISRGAHLTSALCRSHFLAHLLQCKSTSGGHWMRSG